MKPMRGFTLAVGIGWILLTLAGIFYARSKGIPPGIAAPLIAAFLVEYVFYLIPGFAAVREWLSGRIPPRPLALSLALSALAPYLIYSLGTGQFPQALGAGVFVVRFLELLVEPTTAIESGDRLEFAFG